MNLYTQDVSPPTFPSRCNVGKNGKVFIYPHDGRLIGPAWRLAWELLDRSSEPIGLTELAYIVTKMRGNIAEATVVKLLHDAVEEGVVHCAAIPGKGTGKRLISTRPIDLVRALDETPPSWRIVRDILLRGGRMTREEVLERLSGTEISGPRRGFVWTAMERAGVIESDADGYMWRWVGR